MLNRRLTALTLFLALPALTLQAQDREEEFNWSGRVAAGDTLEIRNLNGPISAELTSGDEVEITAVKRGPAGDIEEVRIDVLEHAGGVTVCSLYPDGDAECAAGNRGDLGDTDGNRTNVRFHVRVPAGVHLDAMTMNGAIDAEDIDGNATLETMNGAITASASGWVRADTMNGAVDVSMGAADWSGTLEIESMNGSVTVSLPAGADAEVDAETMNGRVRSDWDISITGHRRNHGRGVIGDGGRRLELSTMNGGIRLERGR